MNDPDTPHHDSDASLPFILRRRPRRLLLAMCFPFVLLLGTIGFLQYQHDEPGGSSFRNALYHSAQLFALHTPHFAQPVPWTLELARWLAAATSLLAAFSVAHRLLHEERTAFRIGRLSGHVIVCGLGRKGLAVVRCLRRQKRAVVVIERTPQPDMAEACRHLGVHVLTGDATNPDALREARIEHALSLIALCPDDSTNYEIAAQARRVREGAKAVTGVLRCQVHLSDADCQSKLQEVMARELAGGKVTLQFFDAYDPEARQVLIHDLPLDHGGVDREEPRPVHLVIIGFGRMGRTLAVRAAQLGHFANGQRLRISVIDRRAGKNEDELLSRYPHIKETCHFEFHPLEVFSPEARALLERWCGERERITSLAVCFDDEQRGLEIAMQVSPLLKTNDVIMAVRMSRQSGLAHLLAEAGPRSELLGRIRPFGMEDRICCLDSLGEDANEKFARDIHAAYVRMRLDEEKQKLGGGATPSPDAALRDWDALPEDFRESNRQQADHIFIKLRALGCEVAPRGDPRPVVSGFTPAEVELLAEMEHRRWVAERQIAGWTYAPQKNAEHRESPSLVPWDKLTEGIKDYDRNTVRLIPTLLAGAGRKIMRRATAKAVENRGS